MFFSYLLGALKKTSMQANQEGEVRENIKMTRFRQQRMGFFDKFLFFVPLPAFASSPSFHSPSSFLLLVSVHPYRAQPHKQISHLSLPPTATRNNNTNDNTNNYDEAIPPSCGHDDSCRCLFTYSHGCHVGYYQIMYKDCCRPRYFFTLC